MNYPSTIPELEVELLKHAKDGRSDAGFRLNIALSELGDLAKHFTHDPIENPIARPHGTKEGEISDAGHAIVQVITYCALRGIPLQKAINSALDNLREKDFIKKEAKNEEICQGVVASIGPVEDSCSGTIIGSGTAFVDPFCENLNDIPKGSILIAHHPTCNISKHSKNIVGIVTDHGGMSCHAAIVSREMKIPCIVGTGNSSSLFKTGDRARMFFNGTVVKINGN